MEPWTPLQRYFIGFASFIWAHFTVVKLRRALKNFCLSALKVSNNVSSKNSNVLRRPLASVLSSSNARVKVCVIDQSFFLKQSLLKCNNAGLPAHFDESCFRLPFVSSEEKMVFLLID